MSVDHLTTRVENDGRHAANFGDVRGMVCLRARAATVEPVIEAKPHRSRWRRGPRGEGCEEQPLWRRCGGRGGSRWSAADFGMYVQNGIATGSSRRRHVYHPPADSRGRRDRADFHRSRRRLQSRRQGHVRPNRPLSGRSGGRSQVAGTRRGP